VAAERRRPDWTIHAIRPARISTPSRIHSQSRLVPELLPEAAALGVVAGVVEVALSVGVAVAVSVAVTVWVDGSAVGVVGVTVGVGVGVGVGVTVGVGVAVAPPAAELTADAALLVALPIALLAALPHPATRHPATSMATGREKPLIVNRMPGPSAWSLVSRTIDNGLTAPPLASSAREDFRASTIPAGHHSSGS
jgi:hypothetical protein